MPQKAVTEAVEFFYTTIEQEKVISYERIFELLDSKYGKKIVLQVMRNNQLHEREDFRQIKMHHKQFFVYLPVKKKYKTDDQRLVDQKDVLDIFIRLADFD